MQTKKLSISLPKSIIYFVENYQALHKYHSRSEVIKDALKLLQKKELEYCYHEASKEIDSGFDITSFDGLEIEEAIEGIKELQRSQALRLDWKALRDERRK